MSKNSPVVITRTCACHDSHSVSLGRDGTKVDRYEVSRCAYHRGISSIYDTLRCDRDHCTPEERAVIETALQSRQAKLREQLYYDGEDKDVQRFHDIIAKLSAAQDQFNTACDTLLATRARTEETK